MSDKVATYKLSSAAQAVAKDWYAGVLELAMERTALVTEYAQERLALEQKFAPRMVELVERIDAKKMDGAKAICAALGIPHDPTCYYAVELSYVEDFGVGFFNVYGAKSEQSAPPGTILN